MLKVKVIKTIQIRHTEKYCGRDCHTGRNYSTATGAAAAWTRYKMHDWLRKTGRLANYVQKDEEYREKRYYERSLRIFKKVFEE